MTEACDRIMTDGGFTVHCGATLSLVRRWFIDQTDFGASQPNDT